MPTIVDPPSPDLEINRAYLNDLVRKALNRPAFEVGNWNVQPIHGGYEWDSAVFRIQGEGKKAGEITPWSLILKTVKRTEKASDPAGIWYWKREALAYLSGMLHHLPGGNFSAPACYSVEERPDGSMWLWMEDIRDDVEGAWPVECYAAAARHLGQFNGAYLCGQALPKEPWIPPNWLRMYVENAAQGIEFIRAHPNHPVARYLFPDKRMAQVLALWDEHRKMLNLLESLPQVFCHQDAFRRNLFSQGGRTIAIDWGYMGFAPVGAELVALVAASLIFFEIPVEKTEELDRLCFEGYLLGLREAGWNGDPRMVRMSYVLSLLYRYLVGGYVGDMLPRMLDQEGSAKIQAALESHSDSEREKRDLGEAVYFQARVQEALKLMGLKRSFFLSSRIAYHSLCLSLGKKSVS